MFYNANIHSSSDARSATKKRLPWMVFDYIDGAAGEGIGEQLNRDAIQNIRLQPRILNNVENRSLASSVFGKQTNLPFGVSPMGMCNLSTPGADLMLARMAARDVMPVGASTTASTSMERIITDAEGNAWKGKLVVKRVLSVDDSLCLKDDGVDAIQLAVGDAYPLFYDSGIRSGEDIVKAYAMGANFVFLGRPLLFAMAADRDHGLGQMRNVFSEEISITLAQLGLTKISEISHDVVC